MLDCDDDCRRLVECPNAEPTDQRFDNESTKHLCDFGMKVLFCGALVLIGTLLLVHSTTAMVNVHGT